MRSLSPTAPRRDQVWSRPSREGICYTSLRLSILSLHLPCESDVRLQQPVPCEAGRSPPRGRYPPTLRSFLCHSPKLDREAPTTNRLQGILLPPHHPSMPPRPGLFHVPWVLQRPQRSWGRRSSRLDREFELQLGFVRHFYGHRFFCRVSSSLACVRPRSRILFGGLFYLLPPSFSCL